MPDDAEGAIEALAARKLADREARYGPVGNPAQWLRAVRDGIRIDHAGRIATMPPGLSVNDQAKWIEHGAPTPGARIPPHEWATPELMSAELWRAGITAARLALAQAN